MRVNGDEIQGSPFRVVVYPDPTQLRQPGTRVRTYTVATGDVLRNKHQGRRKRQTTFKSLVDAISEKMAETIKRNPNLVANPGLQRNLRRAAGGVAAEF